MKKTLFLLFLIAVAAFVILMAVNKESAEQTWKRASSACSQFVSPPSPAPSPEPARPAQTAHAPLQPLPAPAAAPTAQPLAPTANARAIFPIMPYVPVEKSRFGDRVPEVYSLLAKGGCTIVPGYVSDLDVAQAAGLKVLVTDPRVTRGDWKTVTEAQAEKDFLSLLKEINDHPAVAGFFIGDEPGADCFNGIAIVYKLIAKHAPGKMAVLGLLPNYADPVTQCKTPDYETYVRSFVDICKPPMFGYDHYALTPKALYPNDAYWQNLEIFRKIGLEKNIPFFVWIQAGTFLNLREMSAADIRFAIYTVLAYGAKGIGEFPFLSTQVSDYHSEPIDGFGQPSPFFYNFQHANEKLQRLGPELLRLRSDAVYHYTSAGVPAGSRTLAEGDFVKAIKPNTKEYRLLVSEFTHMDSGERYVMVVNCDLKQQVNVTLEFAKAPKAVDYYEPYLGYYIDFKSYPGIPPGEGRLIRVTPKPEN